MPDQAKDKRPHLVLTNTSKAQQFTAPKANGGNKAIVPDQNRAEHGSILRAQLLALQPIAQQTVETQKQHGNKSGLA